MLNLEEKINLLKRIAHRFKEEQIEWALGGSMMLYFKKIVPFFDDIDLMIFCSDVDRVRSILLVMGELKPENPKAKYQTKSFMEFIIEGIDVDVMAGFAIVYEGNVVDCSLEKEQIVEMLPLGTESIPLQSPLLWREYYRLMKRPNKVEMIDKALGYKSIYFIVLPILCKQRVCCTNSYAFGSICSYHSNNTSSFIQ